MHVHIFLFSPKETKITKQTLISNNLLRGSTGHLPANKHSLVLGRRSLNKRNQESLGGKKMAESSLGQGMCRTSLGNLSLIEKKIFYYSRNDRKRKITVFKH